MISSTQASKSALWNKVLISSRPTALINYYLQPQVEDGIIISDRSLMFAIGSNYRGMLGSSIQLFQKSQRPNGCPHFWGDPGTNYLLAIIDIGATIRKIQIVQLSGVTG